MEHIGEILRNQARGDDPAPGRGPGAAGDPQPGTAPEEAVCPVCHGARFVHPLLPAGTPDYSEIVPCRCTAEDDEGRRRSRLERYGNLGPLTRLTFESVDAAGLGDDAADRQQFRRACEAARRFADSPDGWLVLTGPTGMGKTHLAAAIANRAVAAGLPALYISAPDLLDHLRSSFAPGSEMPYDELFDQVRNAPLLVLDDIGAQSATPWAAEKLGQLLNHRFIRRLPTVLVLIVSPDELDERIRVRLTDHGLSQVLSVASHPSTLVTSAWAPGFDLQTRMTFESFDAKRVNLPPELRQNIRDAFRTAAEFARSPEGWLVFLGVNGCGKTHLAAAIVNYRFQHGQTALFIVVPDFLDHLRSTFSPEGRMSYDELFEQVRNAPLLVLDDLGAQSTTRWAQEKLYQVVNYRYNARLATVVTTNCSLDELDNRIASRLADAKISLLFNITAPHYTSDAVNRRKTPHRDR